MIPRKPFLLLRHGETIANAEGFAAGRLDTPLTPLGRDQARATQKAVLSLPRHPRIIFYSPLSRAKDTADIVNEVLGLPMIAHEGLVEQDYGQWCKMDWKIVRPMMNQNIDPPEGETRGVFFERAQTALKECLDQTEILPLIVAHGGIFEAFRSHAGLPSGRIVNCALFEFIPPQTASGDWEWIDHTPESEKMTGSCNCAFR